MDVTRSGGKFGDPVNAFLAVLERVLALETIELQPMLQQAAHLVADVLDADKVDVFLYEASSDNLVAMGTSDTPMGRRQHELGFNCLPLKDGGRNVHVFGSGESFLTGQADKDSEERRDIIENLRIRSQMICPLNVAGHRRGVVGAMSAKPNHYTEQDLRFLQAIAHWIGLVTHRAELVEQATRRALADGRRQAAEELIALLTSREKEVAALVALGLSNAEIAKELTIVPGTVANHVRHILEKLNAPSRARIAAIIAERGLPGLDSEATDR